MITTFLFGQALRLLTAGCCSCCIACCCRAQAAGLGALRSEGQTRFAEMLFIQHERALRTISRLTAACTDAVVDGADNGAEIVEQVLCGLCHRFQGSAISFSGGCDVSA